MNREVFFSLLALDSYNRGYGQGLLLNATDSFSGQNEIGRQIGDAVVIEDNISQSAQDSGFYAIAYEWNDETIVSCRSMNFPGDPPHPRHCEVTQSPRQSRGAPREALDCFAFGSQ